MSDIKIGMVGLGWAASGHIPAFQANENCQIAAVCTSKDEAAAKAMAGDDVAVYSNFEDLLAHDGLDVVDICTPHHLHAEQAIAAAEAGKHLMIEKPLAVTYDALLAMREAVAKAGVKSTVYFELRFIPHFQYVNSVVGQGLLGDVHHLEVDYYHGIGPWYGQYAWQTKKEWGGSALITAGIHALDALVFFAGKPVEEVCAFSAMTSAPYLQEYEYDTTSCAILKFEDGTIGKCVSSVDCRQPYVLNVHLVGSEGTLWNDKLWSTQIDGLRPDEWMTVPSAQAESGDVLDHPYPPLVDEFMECLMEDKESMANFDSAFTTHRVAFAIEKSLEEGRTVKLSELPA